MSRLRDKVCSKFSREVIHTLFLILVGSFVYKIKLIFSMFSNFRTDFIYFSMLNHFSPQAFCRLTFFMFSECFSCKRKICECPSTKVTFSATSSKSPQSSPLVFISKSTTISLVLNFKANRAHISFSYSLPRSVVPALFLRGVVFIFPD
jgi:hypothetical protein